MDNLINLSDHRPPEQKTSIIDIMDELYELAKPYPICVCENPVEGILIKIRLTYECQNCKCVIPLKWANKTMVKNQTKVKDEQP